MMNNGAWADGDGDDDDDYCENDDNAWNRRSAHGSLISSREPGS